jgi:drug/metabolite transporter (DMT)-like permease
MAIFFALLSMTVAGLSDVIYKRYALAPRSRGVYVMGMGAVWTVLQAAIVLASGQPWVVDGQTLAFGLAAGLVVASANLALIESMTHMDAGLASTLYRLNSVVVVVLAVWLLGETLTATKAAGVMLGVAAVVALYEGRRSAAGSVLFRSFLWLAVAAALLRGAFGVVSKAAVARGVDLQMLLLINGPVWIVAGAAYARLREPGFKVTRAEIGFSIVSGTLICAIGNFLMMALARGDASVVVPIANMSFLVTIAISLLIGMERVSARKLVAVALALVAILLLSRA